MRVSLGQTAWEAYRHRQDDRGPHPRRLDLAASLVIRRVLYLDEPTTGLDPRSRNEMWEAVRGLTATGVTVLLTTQYLEEADILAGQIAVVDHGMPSSARQTLATAGVLAGVTPNPGRTARARWASSRTEA